MTATWITIGALAVGTAVSKALGPLTTGGRRAPSARALAVTRLVAPSILAGLVVYETVAADGGVRLDARVVGIAAAALAVAARAPMILVLLAAAAATALARALA